jgi:hypothetical protein
MGMVPFYTRFRDLAFQEMRSATTQRWEDLPDGDYGFLELYCDDSQCDCRRVLIQVIARRGSTKAWATINYGWESEAFYYRRLGDAELAKACTKPTLDPLNPQSKYAPALLRLFETVVQDQAYVQRLQRHYALFKGHGKSAARRDARITPPRRRHK